jgi:hypothetical protein
VQTPEDIKTFIDACLRMEASGNHGSRGGPGGTVDMRRDIAFWGAGRGWQLKKNWRDICSGRWPDIVLPPRPELPPRPKSVSRKALNKLTDQYRSFRSDVGELRYDSTDGRYKGGWRLEVNLTDDPETPYANADWIYLGSNSEDAEASLLGLIANWKKEHKVTGQEPRLGSQPERTGNEPMISNS